MHVELLNVENSPLKIIFLNIEIKRMVYRIWNLFETLIILLINSIIQRSFTKEFLDKSRLEKLFEKQ